MPDDPQLVGDNDRNSPTKMNNQPTSTAAATASRLHRCGDGSTCRRSTGKKLKTYWISLWESWVVFGWFIRLIMFLISFSFLVLSFCFLLPCRAGEIILQRCRWWCSWDCSSWWEWWRERRKASRRCGVCVCEWVVCVHPCLVWSMSSWPW